MGLRCSERTPSQPTDGRGVRRIEARLNRAKRALRKLKTYLGRVIRDIARKIDGNHWLEGKLARLLALSPPGARSGARAARPQGVQPARARVERIGKGKPHKPYEFGVKVSVATTLKHHSASSRGYAGPSIASRQALRSVMLSMTPRRRHPPVSPQTPTPQKKTPTLARPGTRLDAAVTQPCDLGTVISQ